MQFPAPFQGANYYYTFPGVTLNASHFAHPRLPYSAPAGAVKDIASFLAAGAVKNNSTFLPERLRIIILRALRVLRG